MRADLKSAVIRMKQFCITAQRSEKMSEDESRLEVRGTDNEHRKPGE